MSRKLGDVFTPFEEGEKKEEPVVTPPEGTQEEPKNIDDLYKEKLQKEKVEDTHIRSTFLIQKDLKKRLDKVSKNKRGYKTLFINKAIQSLLDELEGK